MSKRRRGSSRSRPTGTRPPGVRPKVSARRGAPPPRRSGLSPAVAGILIVGGLVIAGLGYVAATSFATATPSPLPTFGGAGADGCPTSQPAALPAGETRTVTIQTGLGNIVIKVDGSLSPIAAGNFVALAECGYYDGVVFHRTATMPNGTPFVIQGGDPTGSGAGGPGYTIQDEPVTTAYHRGTVAMARSSQPNSQGSQFFIVLDDGASATLANANTYAIFGEVISGMDVADAIYSASAGQELPANPVTMTHVSVANP
jgi:cyclophilin family peptidyl-prolyl cis-trans isomerase